jgi:hypothetical protein
MADRSGPSEKAIGPLPPIQRKGPASPPAAGHLPARTDPTSAVDWPAVASAAKTATSAAVATYFSTATLVGVVVNAVTASGGRLVGPPINPLILSGMIGGGADRRVAPAFANAVGSAWMMWAATVKVPGLPWYPSFAAVPAPVAPPAPNIPISLVALGAPLTAEMMSASILGALAGVQDPGKEAAVAEFASWFAASMNILVVSTMVTNVLGTGPVPTFAPPYVPVGPVVGGVANQVPGGMVGGRLPVFPAPSRP